MLLSTIVGITCFLPMAIEASRKRNNGLLIVLTFLLGWTFLGWVGSLVWAFTDNTQK